MGEFTRLAIWSCLLAAALAAGVYGILLLRKWFVSSQEDAQREESDSICTTAQLERMREEGLVDEKQYEALKRKVREASRRRAAREKDRRRASKKSGIFR